MSFEIIETSFDGLKLVRLARFDYERGFFFELCNPRLEKKLNPAFFAKNTWSQDNISFSQKGVTRGLHFQRRPFAQAKFIGPLSGKIFDVVVDLRKESPTFAKVYSIELDSKNCEFLYVPEGFAHGFQSLQDRTLCLYKTSNVYDQKSEGSIRWDDPQLGISWPITNAILSKKDAEAEIFCPVKHQFPGYSVQSLDGNQCLQF